MNVKAAGQKHPGVGMACPSASVQQVLHRIHRGQHGRVGGHGAHEAGREPSVEARPAALRPQGLSRWGHVGVVGWVSSWLPQQQDTGGGAPNKQTAVP